jgi:hypothetical protein
VSPGLRSDATTSFRLHAKGRSAAGRTRLRLESEVKPAHVAFDASGHVNSPWQATGPVVPLVGSTTTLDRALTGLTTATRYRWRARYATKNLFFPFTPWFGPHQRGPSQRHIATAGAPLAVGVDPLPRAVGAVALAPASPNPSAEGMSLTFSLPRAGAARLALYDVRGRLVRSLFDGPAVAGETRVTWDGRDGAHASAAPGMYYARLTSLGEERTEKVVRLR